jgi:hypothetical protein
MPARRVATVDERDVHIRMIDKGVREGHAHRTCAHDEVVGLHRSHRHGARSPVTSTALERLILQGMFGQLLDLPS